MKITAECHIIKIRKLIAEAILYHEQIANEHVDENDLPMKHDFMLSSLQSLLILSIQVTEVMHDLGLHETMCIIILTVNNGMLIIHQHTLI